MFFFFNDTATTEIYTLSLHDALPISLALVAFAAVAGLGGLAVSQTSALLAERERRDRKSTRLNSSHDQISYAVFCLKKKNDITTNLDTRVQNVPSVLITHSPEIQTFC